MDKIVITTFFCITLVLVALSSAKRTQWSFEGKGRNKKTHNVTQLAAYTVKSLAKCATDCAFTQYCQSISYNQATHQCILQSISSNYHQLLIVEQPGFSMFDMTPPLEADQVKNISLCQLLTPCQNGANCADLIGPNYQCTCATGYRGKNCEEVSVCATETPCGNGGNCTDGSGLSYSCDCHESFFGENCTEAALLIIGGAWGEWGDKESTELYDAVDPSNNYLFNQSFGDIYNHVSAFLANDTVIVAGGTSSTEGLYQTIFFNWKLNQYTAGPDLNTQRIDAAATRLNGTLIICGGILLNSTILKTCEKLVINSITQQWEWQYMKSMNKERKQHKMVTVNEYAYVIGGSSTDSVDWNLATIDRYSPYTDTWESMAPMKYGKNMASAAKLNGLIYVCGGHGTGDVQLDKCEQYDPVTNQWNDTTPLTKSRHGQFMLAVKGKLMLFGGAYEKSVEQYDPNSKIWTAATPMIMARSLFAVVALG